MKSQFLPPLQPPVERAEAGKLPAGTPGVSASFIGVFGLPFAEDGAVAPSFIFPPLPFAEDGAE